MASSKILTLDEAISRSRAGLFLFSIYEVTTDEFEGGHSAGVRAGQAAFVGARQVHQPPGTPIYFSADTDIDTETPVGREQVKQLQQYLEGCASQVSPTYTVGIYGSYDALNAMADSGAAQFFWQSESTSFSGGRNHNPNPHDHLWQDARGSSETMDNDHALQAWFGQWKAPLIPLDLYSAWRGAGHDDAIWWQTFTGSGWTAQQRVPGAASSDGPELALFNGLLYLAWKGLDGDQNLRWTTYDGKWATPREFPVSGSGGGGSGARPALAAFNDRLYMAWRGAGGNQSLYFASFDGKSWSAEKKIPHVGSAAAPALAVSGTRLYLAWRGAGHDEGMWFTTFDGESWAAQKKIPHVGSAAGPALTLFDQKLYMAWRGAGHDEGLWFTSFDGESWAAQERIPGVESAAGPALAVFGDRLHVTWRGENSDESLYTASFDGRSWTVQEKIGGVGSASGPALLAP